MSILKKQLAEPVGSLSEPPVSGENVIAGSHFFMLLSLLTVAASVTAHLRHDAPLSVQGWKRPHTSARELLCLRRRAHLKTWAGGPSANSPLAPLNPTVWLFNRYRRSIADRRVDLSDQPPPPQRAKDMRPSTICERIQVSRRIEQARAKRLENGLLLCPTTMQRRSAGLRR
jgi:hypothetical protein